MSLNGNNDRSDTSLPSLLITGISGFVGLNLNDYLGSHGNYHIIGTSRRPAQINGEIKGVDTVLSYDEMPAGNLFNAYIHLAGKVLDLKQESSADEYFEANYQLTQKIFDQFVEDDKAEKFVFLSTIHALTESSSQKITEQYQPVPVTPYGESKLKAEQYILQNCPPGKKVYILRPSMIHGPNNSGSLNLLYNFVTKGIPYPMGAFNNKRTFVSVENLCFIIKEIIDREIEPGVYHIADDDPTYTHQLVEQIAQSVKKKPRIWSVSPWLLRWVARLGNYIPIPLNEHRFNKLTGDFIVSNRKIKEALGKPLPVSAKEGIDKTINSFNRQTQNNCS